MPSMYLWLNGTLMHLRRQRVCPWLLGTVAALALAWPATSTAQDAPKDKPSAQSDDDDHKDPEGRRGRRQGRRGGWGRMGERSPRMRDDGAPKVGMVAPLFTLKTLDGKGEVALASFSGKRPVVLFFGSYT